VRRFPELGFCVVASDEPLHYYPLFSQSAGLDVQLTCYPRRRYELEQKYTTYVNLKSRTVRDEPIGSPHALTCPLARAPLVSSPWTTLRC